MVYDMINRTEYSRVLNENKMLREEISKLLEEIKLKREENEHRLGRNEATCDNRKL